MPPKKEKQGNLARMDKIETAEIPIVNTDEQIAIQLIEKLLDTTTWLLVHIGPLSYCSLCKSYTCICPEPFPPMEHEDLKIGQEFANIGEAVRHLVKHQSFPKGSIFATKDRGSKASALQFCRVEVRTDGELMLREDLHISVIEAVINWKNIAAILRRRTDYDTKRVVRAQLSTSIWGAQPPKPASATEKAK